MNRRIKILLAVLGVTAGLGFALWNVLYGIVEKIDYHDPPHKFDFVDDKLADKNPAFDETLVDSRPLGGWELNKSGAVIKLDCPVVKPDREASLLVVRPSYADALKAAKAAGFEALPSANLLDGAAKQFDDGLYAAIELAVFRGELGLSPGVPDFLQALFDESPASSPARPFLAAALELGGKQVVLRPAEAEQKRKLLVAFESDKERSRPIAFYNWTPELQQVWRCFRFLQLQFSQHELEVPLAVAAVLEHNSELLAQYRLLTGLYAGLTNPAFCLPVDALIGAEENLPALAARLGAPQATVSIFPPSTSRETELFNRVFAFGLPAGANLMATLIQHIRSGDVDLAPRETSGWYQHQVYALETMLLPTRGQEGNKLLLTASYKKRLVEAFKALVTKRRETHSRHIFMYGAGGMVAELQPDAVRPRLRVEPCVTFYLRTARAYAFLENFLVATIGQDRLQAIHALKKDGLREPPLAEELGASRERFYGFYLISCEDIGMRPEFLEGELVSEAEAKSAALAWLTTLRDDPDLARDTRVSVPVFRDNVRNKTRLWATLGVRLARLDATYARAPKVRPFDQLARDRRWRDPESWQLGESHFVIPVDEFAEFELNGSNVLTRAELRALCDKHKTKEAILDAIGAMR